MKVIKRQVKENDLQNILNELLDDLKRLNKLKRKGFLNLAKSRALIMHKKIDSIMGIYENTPSLIDLSNCFIKQLELG